VEGRGRRTPGSSPGRAKSAPPHARRQAVGGAGWGAQGRAAACGGPRARAPARPATRQPPPAGRGPTVPTRRGEDLDRRDERRRRCTGRRGKKWLQRQQDRDGGRRGDAVIAVGGAPLASPTPAKVCVTRPTLWNGRPSVMAKNASAIAPGSTGNGCRARHAARTPVRRRAGAAWVLCIQSTQREQGRAPADAALPGRGRAHLRNAVEGLAERPEEGGRPRERLRAVHKVPLPCASRGAGHGPSLRCRVEMGMGTWGRERRGGCCAHRSAPGRKPGWRPEAC